MGKEKKLKYEIEIMLVDENKYDTIEISATNELEAWEKLPELVQKKHPDKNWIYSGHFKVINYGD